MATVSSTVWSSPHLPAQRWRWAGLVVVVSAAISVWVILTAPEGETDLGLRDLAGGCTWLAAGVMVLLWTLPRAGQRKGGLLVALAMVVRNRSVDRTLGHRGGRGLPDLVLARPVLGYLLSSAGDCDSRVRAGGPRHSQGSRSKSHWFPLAS